VESAAGESTASNVAPVVAQPASLLTGDVRAALRLLATFLVQGNGTGFAARLPYDIDLR
jgi:hypothetical protein